MKITRISAGVAAVVLSLAFAGTALAADATVTGHEAFSNEANQPGYWGDNCEDVGVSDVDSYVLPDIDGTYDQVIVKSGSGEFANTIFDDPAEGSTVWADTNGNFMNDPGGKDGDKQISHIIVCIDEPVEDADADPDAGGRHPDAHTHADATPTPTPRRSGRHTDPRGQRRWRPISSDHASAHRHVRWPSSEPGNSSWLVLLVVLTGIVASALVLTPNRSRRR